ncbi:MAG: MmgE/PrpD family protein [Acidobacteriota bacterium]
MSPPPVLRDLADWAVGLRWDDVPGAVREAAKDQVLSTLAAVHYGYRSPLGQPIARAFAPPAPGNARVLPTGAPAQPPQAAFLMAAWSMVLDYDDVMLGGHTGHSSVLVPWAHAREHSGRDLLLAQIVANEIAARINMVCAVGSTRGQMATHLHLIAAAAARARLVGLSAESYAEALSFALSYPAEALFPAFLGSDAKALCAAWPIRMGLDAVAAVGQGLRAATDPLDDPRGFFASRATVPVREFLGGLGERWHTLTNSFKAYPACGYLEAVLEAAEALSRQSPKNPDEISRVRVKASIFTVGMDAHSEPYLDGGRSPLVALTFSTPYTVACALLDGGLRPEHLAPPWTEDPQVWELAGKVQVEHDFDRTLAALVADIPIGAALRRVKPWQAAGFGLALAGKAWGRFGRWRRPWLTTRLALALGRAAGRREPLDLSRSTKPLGAEVTVITGDGRRLRQTVDTPRGFAGGDGPAEIRRLMRQKFLDATREDLGARADRALTDLERLDRLSADEVRHLVELLCFTASQVPQPELAEPVRSAS